MKMCLIVIPRSIPTCYPERITIHAKHNYFLYHTFIYDHVSIYILSYSFGYSTKA